MRFSFISFAISILTFVAVADNPTSIVAPYNGPDPGYILAESNGGLANRLRVLAAYIYIGHHKYHGAHLVFIWDKNEACPGHFLSIFEPVNNVAFATNSSRYVLDKHAKIVYENSYAVFNWIMQMNGIPKSKFGHLTWGQIEYLMYSKFYPVREVMIKVNEFVEKHNICNSSSMHIRQTDLDKVIKRKLSIDIYFRFVESRPLDEKVFLLTDNPETQRLFQSKYGNSRIIVFDAIKESTKQLPLLVRNVNDTKVPVALDDLATEHRYTSIEHTLVDVLIAAHSKKFQPSPFSSLSDLVKIFESIGKKDRGWCMS